MPPENEKLKQTFHNYALIRQEHLNQYGSLFGGHLLSIIDEMAYITCIRSFPGRNFVTRALQDVEFHTPARLGDILETHATIARVGKTSCQVQVQVFICHDADRPLSFDGTVILVCVDDQGKSRPIES